MANTIKLGTDSNWAVKENNLLAYNDENNIFKPIDFDFTRDSGATRVNEQGLIENVPIGVPRIDFSDGKGSLLLEPQSTNLITYSEDFSDASWLKSNTTITSNSIISPKGDLTADKLIASATSSSHYLRISVTSVSDATLSFFIKKAEEDIVFVGNATSSQGAEFDLTNGVVNSVVGGSADIVDYGNGWYRCSYTRSSFSDWQYLSLRGNLTSYLGDGTSGVYIFGAQLEQQSYPTSYIPTSGATATRNAETSSKANISNLINSSEGVLYAEMSALANNSTFKQFALTDGSANNLINLDFTDTDNEIRFFSRSGGVVYGNDRAIITDATSINKIAVSWKINDVKVYVNGVSVITDTTYTTPLNLNRILFDNGSGVNNFYGKVKDLRVYNQALTDTELQQLTS